MEQKTKMFALAILVAFVVGSMVGVVAAIEPGVYINGNDVTDQFVEDRSELKGAFTADSSSVRLAELYAQYYMSYLTARHRRKETKTRAVLSKFARGAQILAVSSINGKPKDDRSATSRAKRVAHFAIVSCGSTHGSPQHKKWYWGSNQRIHKMLREVYGYPDEAIFRLHEEGKPKDPAVDGKSSLANFRKLFAHLAKIMKKGDHLFIYIVGHGEPLRRGQWDGDYVHDLVDARLTGTEFDKMLDSLPSQNISIAMNPCHSGGFIPKISGKGRVICTSTRGTQSNSAGWEGYFTNALAGMGEVDADGDGRISMKEAYNASVDGTLKWYANKKRLLREHPLLDDNGDGKGHYGKDKVVDGDGELAAKRFLGDEGKKLEYKSSAVRALKKLNE